MTNEERSIVKALRREGSVAAEMPPTVFAGRERALQTGYPRNDPEHLTSLGRGVAHILLNSGHCPSSHSERAVMPNQWKGVFCA